MMKLNIPAPAIAFARHVPSYLAGAVTMAAAFQFVSPDDAKGLTTALQTLFKGLETTEGALMSIVSIISAAFAARSATASSNIARVASLGENDVTARQALINAVAANPAVAQIVTTPEIARDTPSEKVVAQ